MEKTQLTKEQIEALKKQKQEKVLNNELVTKNKEDEQA